MSAPSFRLQLPPLSLFRFPPDPSPPALPPPTDARTFASPFAINEKLYNDVLDWKVPVTIGAVYMTTAILMNKVNRDRKHVPFGFAKTTAFHYFVIAHNVFLAIFSALTFFGMMRALAHTWPGRRDLPLFGKYWPGLRTENGLPGAADALCKMHGPRGFGDAVFYNADRDVWETANRNIKLAMTGHPDSTDVGRLWNEGLAFWGWWFYLSKFYEVLDTFIILAKGKRSSTLQTYHHTGAMACMWAGIRFMSPPIWMFCFINSGIHALMYTYYTLAALRVRVPRRIKRTLTTMQITQFLIGITFASLHLFVHYSIPVATPITTFVGNAVAAGASAVSSAAAEAASKAPEVAAAVAPSVGTIVRKLLLRAAGEEGMAQRVAGSGTISGAIKDGVAAAKNHHSNDQNQTKTAWETQYEYIPCLDTTGQAFAIWLNLFYLAPLTLLFTRFFIRSYTQRGASKARRISGSAVDAAKGTERKVDEVGKSAEKGVDAAEKAAGDIKTGPGDDRVTPAGAKGDKTNNRTQKSQRSVSSDVDTDAGTKQAETAQSESTTTQGLADKVEQVGQELGSRLSKAADEAVSAASSIKRKFESMDSSKLSDMSFSIVDHNDLESSTEKPIEPGTLLHKIEDHEAPTFAEVADPQQPTAKAEDETKSELVDSASSPTYAEVADPEEPTHVSEAKPHAQSRSNSSRSQQSDRSSSPSKRNKSKIPQPTNRASVSPAKKVLSPATVTTSMSAHSGTAFKDGSTAGNA